MAAPTKPNSRLGTYVVKTFKDESFRAYVPPPLPPDLPIVEFKNQKRPTLKAAVVTLLITGSEGQEQVLYVLLASTGMRISEALALETKHFINGGRTIVVGQQVMKDRPRIVSCLKAEAAHRRG
jgi:integrase